MNAKGTFEAIREWWAERVLLRTGYGNPALTRAVSFLDQFAASVVLDEGDAEGKILARRLHMQRDDLVHGGASEGGWAMDRDIAAIEAATPKAGAYVPGSGGAS